MNAPGRSKGNSPKRHHVVQKSYLAHFADPSTKQLCAFDCETGKQVTVNLDDAAVQKDFYKSKFRDDRDPMAVERALADLESKLAPAIERVVSNGAILAEDKDLVLNFVTLLFVRGPKQRTLATRIAEKLTNDLHQSITSSPAAWEQAINDAKARGEEVPPIPYAAAKYFLTNHRVNVNLPNSWHIESMVNLSGPILSLCAKRSWAVARTTDGLELLTSDSPVTLIGFGGHGLRPLGFGSEDTLALLPLTPNLLLYGRLGDIQIENPLSPERVALINTNTICGSHRFVYGRSSKVSLWNGSGIVEASSQVIKSLKDRAIEMETRVPLSKPSA